MAIIELDADYSASFFPYRHGRGYVAKGTVFCRGKIVEIFDARGVTISAVTKVAQTRAMEIHQTFLWFLMCFINFLLS